MLSHNQTIINRYHCQLTTQTYKSQSEYFALTATSIYARNLGSCHGRAE